MASFIFTWKLVEAESRISQQSSELFRPSQVLKDVGMLVSGEMFTDASGEVSIVCLKSKSSVGLEPRVLSLQAYDRESFISFHVQAVVPVLYW